MVACRVDGNVVAIIVSISLTTGLVSSTVEAVVASIADNASTLSIVPPNA